MLYGDECESVCHGNVQHIASNMRAQFLLKFRASLGGSYARFEARSSLDKASFILGNELWEEYFESLLALIIDLWGFFQGLLSAQRFLSV